MGYNDDNCMILFTAEQANRSVCGLVNYRQSLFNRDTDGIADVNDNCPTINNAGQENLDGDGLGDVCDDDVDGDGVLNVEDPDDDNDGKTDADELSDTDDDGEFTDPFDPDSDDDGIRDGLDVEPNISFNACDPDANAPVNFVGGNIATVVQCAAPEGVIVKSVTHVMDTGSFQVITPKATEFETGFKVEPGGKLSVFSEELPAP